MSCVADFHCHVLPGIDDGSSSVAESLRMLRRMSNQGIRFVIATPHFYPQYDAPEVFLRKRKEAEILLRQQMRKYADLPKMQVGAEVHYFHGMSGSDALEGLTIGGKRCILIEMPECRWTENMYRELEEISVRRGLTPIVAHVDRYISPFRTHGIPDRLAELPVLVQANAGFFLNPATRSMALKLLRQDRIHLLGSDSHNLTSRPPRLGEAVEVIRERLGSEALTRIAYYQRELLWQGKTE